MSSLNELRARLSQATSAILALRPNIEAGEPWPLSDNFGTEPEAHWGARETLAHVEEMLPFWLGEIERILDVPGDAEPPFGRVATDSIRLAVIERDRTLPLRELFGRIEAYGLRVERRLAELGEADLARSGSHPRLGHMTVEHVVDRFVVGHLEEHGAQLRDILIDPGR
jgi:hypothetical protein